MVNIGDIVRVKQLSEDALDELGPRLADPSGREGEVTDIDPSDRYPVMVRFEPEDDEDNRQYPDFYRESELEVVKSD